MRFIILAVALGLVLSQQQPILEKFSQLSDSTFDDALQLLSKMYCAIVHESRGVSTEESVQALKQQLMSIKQQRNLKQTQCKQLEADINTLKTELDKNANFILWLKSRIQSNERKIKILQGVGCQQSTSFLKFMKLQTIEQKLLNFLTEQMDKCEERGFAQLRNTISFIQEIKPQIEDADGIDLLLEQMERKADGPFIGLTEAGCKLKTDKEDILSLVEKFQSYLDEQTPILENNQISSKTSQEKFINQIQTETALLRKHLQQIQSLIGTDPDKLLKCKEDEKKRCDSQLQGLDKQIQISVLTIENQSQRVISKEDAEKLNQKAKLIKEIIKLYSNGISHIDENLKKLIVSDEKEVERKLETEFDDKKGELDEQINQITNEIIKRGD